MAITFTQDQVDAFVTAMQKNPGVMEMRIGDRLYKFSTLREMEEHAAYMQRNLAVSQAGRVRYAGTSKGLHGPCTDSWRGDW